MERLSKPLQFIFSPRARRDPAFRTHIALTLPNSRARGNTLFLLRFSCMILLI